MGIEMAAQAAVPPPGQPELARAVAAEDAAEILVYDFFSGCGGTSAGLRRAGMTPVFALDFDREAASTYRLNFPQAAMICGDVRQLSTGDIERYFQKPRTKPVLFSACAPCQPFSRQNRQKSDNDGRITLISELHRFVERFRPELLLIENVPGLKSGRAGDTQPFPELVNLLDRLGYHHDSGVLRALDFGVPQSRQRLFLIASAFGQVKLPAPTHGTLERPYPTVREVIEKYPELRAGGDDPSVPNHRACGLSPKNLERIQATPAGCGRLKWSEHLRLDCHEGVKGFTDVYGRMWWDRPAPAMTTRCISLSNGRFGHPEQDRAISIREAAAIQTFDDDFVFTGSVNGMARQIGNAVPVELAHAVGQALLQHVRQHVGTIYG
jgi:DNA (cytosine-5)-methyltransferase 1